VKSTGVMIGEFGENEDDVENVNQKAEE